VEGTTVLTIDDVRQRAERLERLARGLCRERTRARLAQPPLPLRERRLYLCALDDALFGVEGARLALVQAMQRLGRPAEAA
jgi:hypothetical protein